MGSNVGNAIASVPGASFDISTDAGYNLFNKSGMGTSSSDFSNRFSGSLGDPILLEKNRLLDDTIDNIKYLRSFEIIVRRDSRWPTWLIAIISVVAGLIIIVFLFFCLRTEGGRAACLCVLGICLICCSNSGRRH